MREGDVLSHVEGVVFKDQTEDEKDAEFDSPASQRLTFTRNVSCELPVIGQIYEIDVHGGLSSSWDWADCGVEKGDFVGGFFSGWVVSGVVLFGEGFRV